VLRGNTQSDTFEIGNDDRGESYAVINGLRVVYSNVKQLTLDSGKKGEDSYRIAGLSVKTTIVASAEIDWLDFSYSAVQSGVTIDLNKSSPQQVFGAANPNTLTLKGTIENVIGTNFADWIKGNSAKNRIEGRGGNDTLYGGSGDDTLYGEAGDDWLYGEARDDCLYGGPGNNVLLGGTAMICSM
jgi:Ca2+-binding RTX toxin-like protein